MLAGRGVDRSYAAINRQWQAYFERENFKHLILGYYDIQDFGTIVIKRHRGHLVRWAWLRLELPQYGCDRCKEAESAEETRAHEDRFTTALEYLLYYLSKLNNDDHPGITLELSVHSPSDSEHFCQELRNTINDTMWYASLDHLPIRHPDDVHHCWVNGQRVALPPGAYHRVFGNPHGLRVRNPRGIRLKTVKAVNELVIRLQFFRHFSVQFALEPITQSLPRLERITYECRQGITRGEPMPQRLRQMDHRIFFDLILPRCGNLRKVSMHEEETLTLFGMNLPRVADAHAGRSLALHSGHLRELYMSYLVDAADFFHNFSPSADQRLQRPQWPRLEYLFLTTMLPTGPSCAFLIRSAARAAEHMPRLQNMEIWGMELLGEPVAYIFAFQVQDRHHSVLLVERERGLRIIDEDTRRSWETVVAMRGSPYGLEVKRMDRNEFWAWRQEHSMVPHTATHTSTVQVLAERDRRARGFYW